MEEAKLEKKIKKLCEELENIEERVGDVMLCFQLVHSDFLFNIDPMIENKIKNGVKKCENCLLENKSNKSI